MMTAEWLNLGLTAPCVELRPASEIFSDTPELSSGPDMALKRKKNKF